MSGILNFQLPIEPIISNRFTINPLETGIPVNNFRKYNIFNEGKNLFLSTEIFETVDFVFDPKNFFRIKHIRITYLNALGEEISVRTYVVKGEKIEHENSYADCEISTYKMKFLIID